MRAHVEPGLAVSAAAVFGGAEDVVFSCDNGDRNGSRANGVGQRILDYQKRQEVSVTAEPARVHADCAIQTAEQGYHSDAEPFHRGVRDSCQG